MLTIQTDGGVNMVTKETIWTRQFVSINQDIFEDMAKSYVSSADPKKYSILNYEDILTKMCDFIDGYIDYKVEGTNKYKGRILGTTVAFYNTIFLDNKYRTVITLKQFRGVTEKFLKLTKKLQDIMEKNAEKQDQDFELQEILTMTDNQYKKLARVFRDDMEIYMWLCSEKSFRRHQIPVQLRMNHMDITTPVMHPANLKENNYKEPDKSVLDDDGEPI